VSIRLNRIRRISGFSVVELMVALTLSLVLMAGALSILYSSKLTSKQNDRMARVQEAGRMAMEILMQDGRAAGFMGCVRPLQTGQFNNGLTSATSLLWNLGQATNGFHSSGATWIPALDATIPASPTLTQKSDVLVLRAARPNAPVFRTNATFGVGADIPIDLVAGTTLATPATAIISDCRGEAVFSVTAFTSAGTTGTLSHDTSGSGSDPVNGSTSLPRAFDKGAQIVPVSTQIYYVASCPASPATTACTSGATPPALWLLDGSRPASPPQELIRGVDAMQVRYGVDTDGDLLANSYTTADLVSNWGQVVSVNVWLLVRSVDDSPTEARNTTYTLSPNNSSVSYNFTDGRQRSIFTTTITLRNWTP
jgi:type IV pilus assembly protein PilW